MRIVTRLLLIGLCACGVAFYGHVAPLAQQPGTVTVRPRIAATRPGMPEVKVTVDNSSVPAGAEVVFALNPARVISDPGYRVTLFFGDGKRQVVRQTRVSHVYPQAGTYTYSVLVEGESRVDPTPTPVPPVPSVKLSASPTSVEVNQPVSFSAQVSRRYQNLKYQFFFGDGSTSGWQDDAKATHSYRAANTFKAYVDIGVFSNGFVKQAGGSERESITVTERPVIVSVKLTANPASIEAGKPVTFTARPSLQSSNAEYQFAFGDTSATGWQASPRATHRYNAAGNYSARVEVRVANRTNAPQSASDATTVEVTEPVGPSKVDLKVIPATVPLGVPVLFQAIPSAENTKARYRFNFGDGSSTSWSSDPLQTHSYNAAGTYPAFVEMASVSEPVKVSAASGKKRVRVMPIRSHPDTNDNRNSNGNSNSNTGNSANSNATPRSNTNSGANSNGNSNTGRNANSNANSNTGGNTNSNTFGQVNGNVNLQTNTNFRGNVNSNTFGQVNGNVNLQTNTNSGGNVNATNANSSANGNANANSNSTNAGNSNANASNANSSVASATVATSEPGAKGGTTDWWKYLIIAAIILFAAYQAFSYFFAPRPTFEPHFNPGDSQVSAGKPLSIDLQLDVDPNIQAGEFSIDTQGNSLIKSKRTEP